VCFLGACHAQSRSLSDNLAYRLARGDLAGVAPDGHSDGRTLGIRQGADVLLRNCVSNPARWANNSSSWRFGHRTPESTISCRELATPSLHVVFYPQADGSRTARVHFDLHGPRNPVGHLSEVLRNGLSNGRTSQYDVYCSLI